ncbi:nucleotide exchange factor GrpE [Angustibacter sp. McL0619]|uniref:nucleotide exchange factor GrpE n=1 Tax=Angustibacter sp. McL0619 TaxID=3415676 RepID=UPI003CF686B9
MTDGPLGGRPFADDGSEPPVVRDKRRIDPQTGRVRDTGGSDAAASEHPQPQVSGEMANETEVELGLEDKASGPTLDVDPDADPAGPAVDLAVERLADLQRLQAEYVNYRRRVERDRDVARDLAVASILESLLPVMDDLHLARQHGDLESGPFASVADKIEAILSRAGLERFGEVGEAFDPAVHEALMHVQAELAAGTEVTTVVQVLQPGYRAGERVLRAARVAVADPQDPSAATE